VTLSSSLLAACSCPTGTVTVNYATANGTATDGADYTSTSGTLTFSATETSKTVTITVLADTLDEHDETVLLNLSSARHGTIGDGQGVGTVTDNDPPPTAQFSASSYTVAEDGVNATITVTLSAASGKTVTVYYATSNGTATAGTDYTTTTGSVVFDPGQTSKTFTVPILDDTTDEWDETVNLTLTGYTYATAGSPTAAVLRGRRQRLHVRQRHPHLRPRRHLALLRRPDHQRRCRRGRRDGAVEPEWADQRHPR
jgi:hypothetical protein